MIVHSYARFSDPKQEGGDSIRRQRQAAEEFCERKKWTLSDLTFTDRGRSGFSGDKQRALNAFLKAVDDGLVKPGETLLVEAVDRLSRKGVRATQNLVNNLLDAGINIAILVPVEKIYRADDSNDIGGAIELAAFAFQAHTYSENLSSRIKSYNAHKRSQLRNGSTDKITGQVPSWLNVEEDGSFTVNKDAAKAIKYIFKRTIDGIGRKVLLQELGEKFQPIASVRKSARSTMWNETLVGDIIRSRRVLGELKSTVTGEVFKDYYPKVITEKTWLQANAAAARRRTRRGSQTKRINLFNGILFHPVDDCAMGFYSYTQKQKKRVVKYHRYKSYKKTHGVKGADSCTVDVKRFEDLIFHFLPKLQLQRKQVDPQADLMAQRDYLKSEIKALQDQITSQNGSAAVLAEPLMKLGEQLDEVEGKLIVTPAKLVAPTRSYRDELKKMRRGTIEERELVRDRIQQIVDKIYLLPIKLGTQRRSPVRSLVEIHFKSGESVRAIEIENDALVKISGNSGESLLEQCKSGFRVSPDDYRTLVELVGKE